MAMGVTEKLAARAFDVRYEDMPQEVIEKAKDCLLDQIGEELIGSTLDWNKIAYRYVVEMGGRAESTSSTTGPRRRC
jgi:2-methylcitrate dehydratase PrpD